MDTAYSGAWRKRYVEEFKWPSIAGTVPDPQHSDPSSNPGNRRPDWVTDGARFEYPPVEWTADQSGAFTVDHIRAVLVDGEPESHDYGVGTGAALPLRQSMSQNQKWHDKDLNSVTARRYSAPNRRDGEYHADLLQEPVYPVGSPGSLVFQQEANPETSPNASIRGPGKRVTRWFDRKFQDNNWRNQNDHTPSYVPTAYTAPEAGPVPNGSQYTSPYPTAAATTVRNVVTVLPQLRRNPRPWDESYTTDGTEEIQTDPGFFSGGL